MRLRRPSPALSVALLALVVAIGGIAVAAPGGGGSIKGCYNDRGALRVVDSGASCEAGETALTWNQQGPPGPVRAGTGQTFGAGDPPNAALSPGMTAPVKKPSKKAQAKLAAKASGAPTSVFTAIRTAQFEIPGPATTIATVARLELGTGRYFVVAKARTGPAVVDVYISPWVVCRLVTGNKPSQIVQLDELTLALGSVVHMTAALRLKKPGRIELRCTGHLGSGGWGKPMMSDVKLSALNVAKIKTTKTKPPY